MEEGANYVPSLREYSARWCVTPERLRPAQKVMHPGPMNRGVEIDPRVADSSAALVVDQVRAGLVVRMAVLYDLLTTGPGRGRDGAWGWHDVLARFSSAGAAPTTSSSAARACSTRPRASTRCSTSASTAARSRRSANGLDANGHRVVDGAGLVLAPAFVDPHVHLRTPGREDEETIATGTAAAAAGGYCAILAMPNTVPVVDTRRRPARPARPRRGRGARSRSASPPRSRSGQEGTQLTEMGELADAGAAAFTDDGRPVATAGLMRRALEYNAITGRRLALHCEEPTLTHGGHMHMGAVSAELGLGGWPSLGESLGVVARALARRRHPAAAAPDAPLGARVGRAARAAPARRASQASGEVTPHHLCLTDEAVRSLDPNLKMNPPLRTGDDRAALIEALDRRDDRGDRDRPRAALARGEGRARSRRRRSASPGSRPRSRRSTRSSSSRAWSTLETLLERMSAGPGADLRPRAAADRRRRAARTSSC